MRASRAIDIAIDGCAKSSIAISIERLRDGFDCSTTVVMTHGFVRESARCVEGAVRGGWRAVRDDDGGGDDGDVVVVGGGGDGGRVRLSSGRASGDASEASGGARSREVCDDACVGW